MPRIGQKLKLFLVVFGPAFLLLVLLEITATTLTYRDTSVRVDALTGEPYLYEMQIGRFPFDHISTVPLNRLGFPDEDFLSVRKAPGCIHILLLGDSFTFGDTVDGHRSWISVLRRALSKEYPGECIRLFNAGERSSTLDRQLLHYRAVAPLLQPDLVVLGQYQNDLSDLTQTDLSAVLSVDEQGESTEDAGTPMEPWRNVVQNRIPIPGSSAVRLIAYHLFAGYIVRGTQHDILDRWSVLAGDDTQLASRLVATYEELFAMLLDELGDTPLATIVFPSKMDVMAQRYPEGEFFNGLSSRHEIPSLDLTPLFLEERRPYAFQMYDGHLNERGNEIVADRVLQWLLGDESSLPRDGSGVEGLALDLGELLGRAARNYLDG